MADPPEHTPTKAQYPTIVDHHGNIPRKAQHSTMADSSAVATTEAEIPTS
jgi:hypothetical protein